MPVAETTSTDQQATTYAVYSWQWKDDAAIEQIERGFDEMCAMGDDIAGVRQSTWGRNAADAAHASGYTHSMVIIANDEAAVNEYNLRTSKHPMADEIHASEKLGVGILFSRPA